jgi:hypothetical protein
MGKLIHDPQIAPDDVLAGPVIGESQRNPAAVRGSPNGDRDRPVAACGQRPLFGISRAPDRILCWL